MRNVSELQEKIEALKPNLTWAQAEALDAIAVEVEAQSNALSELSVIVAELVTASAQ